ncbi:MAG: HD domain-containing protein [bacterium]
MNARELYARYQIPPNLQEHMLRVTFVAGQICDRWRGPQLDRGTITTAALTHDLGNLLKFDLVHKAHFLGSEEKNVEHWKKVKQELMLKYGEDENVATNEMCKEIGIDPKAFWIVNNWGFSHFEQVKDSQSWEYKICVYSDHRVGPFGLLTLGDRFADQQARYKLQGHQSAHVSDQFEKLRDCAYEVEKQIQEHVSVDLNALVMHDVQSVFDTLLSVAIA